MATCSVVGFIGRDGVGEVTYVAADGYPTGVGRVLLENFVDAESVKRLLEHGMIEDLGVSEIADVIALQDRHYEHRWVEGSSRRHRVFYRRGSSDTFPIDLEPVAGFFDREWPRAAAYIYVLTPDGWLGCACLMHKRGERHEPTPLAYLVEEGRKQEELDRVVQREELFALLRVQAAGIR